MTGNDGEREATDVQDSICIAHGQHINIYLCQRAPTEKDTFIQKEMKIFICTFKGIKVSETKMLIIYSLHNTRL